MKKYFSYIFTLFLSVSLFVQCSNVAQAQLYNPTSNLFNGTISGTTSINGTLNFNNNAVFVSGTGTNLTNTRSPSTVSTTTVFKVLNQFAFGTWTGSIVGATSTPTSVTYSDQVGYYIKLMDIVCVMNRITISGITGGGGNVSVSGMPYVVSNINNSGGGVVTAKSGWLTSGPDFVTGDPNKHSMLMVSDGNTVGSALTIANVTSSMAVAFQGCYPTTE